MPHTKPTAHDIQQVDALLNNLLSTKPTDSEQRELNAMQVRATVCNLLRLKDEEYSNFMYNTGCTYLYYLLNDDDYIISGFEKSPLFWQWWNGCYAIRDEVFCQQMQYDPINAALDVYIQLHNGRLLAIELKPPRCVWKEVSKIKRGV